MDTKLRFMTGFSLILLIGHTGCATLPYIEPMDVGEVGPRPGERIAVEELVVLVDVTGSMGTEDKYSAEKALVEAFVQAIPAGEYHAAIHTYAGDPTKDWVWHRLRDFNREKLEASAAEIDYLGGHTHLDIALEGLRNDMDGILSIATGHRSRGALVLFSDGLAERGVSLEACERLVGNYFGDLCVYTVQIGDDDSGRDLLEDLSSLGDCGATWTAEEISSPGGMEHMVREIFFEIGELDSDGDGVLDSEDECPDTPRGARVDDRGCWVLDDVLFEFDKYDIRSEYEYLLDEVAEVLAENPDVRVRIDGHTDSVASEVYNQGLSENRAQAVKDALVNRDIAAERLETRGFGETRPVRSNDTAADRAFNRRVELTVID